MTDYDNDEPMVKVSELAERVTFNKDSEWMWYERPKTHLRGDFFDGEWRRAEPAVGGDRLDWSEVHGKTWTGMFGGMHTVDEDDDTFQALLPIPMTGRGDYNNTAVWMRSNMNVLLEEYPDTFITIGRSSHDGQQLALPMDAEIPEALAERIEPLWGDSYCLDDDAQSKLEMEIVDEDWDSWLESDFKSAVQKHLAEVFNLDIHEVDMDDYLEERLTRRGVDLRTLFANAMENSGTYPEFETSESCYIRDLETTIARFAVSDLIEGEPTP